VFLNNPSATQETPASLSNGYAGSFYVFGHGGCYGEVGHCQVSVRRPYDFRPNHPLTPITKTLTITHALQRALAAKQEVFVTIVPIVKSKSVNGKFDSEDVLHFKSLEIVTYAS